jgi:hypothetical protein
MQTIYASKIDLWLALILIGSMAVCAFAAYRVIGIGHRLALLSAILMLVIGIGLPLWLMTSTSYSLSTSQLLIKSGPFKWVVPIATIVRITPTSSSLSSPALSLDRIRIDYGNRESVMISPKNLEQFLKDLGERRRSPENRKKD